MWPNVGFCGTTMVCPALVAQRWFLWHNDGLPGSCGSTLVFSALVIRLLFTSEFKEIDLYKAALLGARPLSRLDITASFVIYVLLE